MRHFRAAAAALLSTFLLTSCLLGTAATPVKTGTLAGPLQGIEIESGSISIGSKNFTEQFILGKMTVILLRSAGAEVKDFTNMPGSAAARQAHLEGQIHAMWEYTGTAWLTYLGNDEPIKDPQEQYDRVAAQDREENQIEWLKPSPLNNSYAFAVTKESQEEYGLSKMSQMADIPVAERTICTQSEFANRPDGLPAMLDTYGIPLDTPDGVPGENIKMFQVGAIYEATVGGECTFGEATTTDGRNLALDLQVLEDDKQYFPLYNAALVVRQDTLQEMPQLREIFDPLSAALNNDVLLKLNARVDVDGEEPADVAWDWLVEEGFVKPN